MTEKDHRPQQPARATAASQPVAPPVTNAQTQPPQPVYISVQPPAEQPSRPADEHGHAQLLIYSHSSLFYWWPVWAIGYLMALLTYLNGQQHQIGVDWEWFHPSSNPGVIFFITLFLVILITNVAVRGLASVIVILSVILVTVLLAWFEWWDTVLGWVGDLRVHLNLGAYLFISTLVFVIWAFTTFVFDRMSYWRIKPGQITHEFILGAASRSYDTENLVLEKYRDDIFRHWVLGIGSGDLHIKPYGADKEEIAVPNVLFIGSKVHTIQHMIATEPESFGHSVLK